MEHRIVTPDEETKRDYEAHEDIFDRTKNGFESRAPYFRLIWHFECFRRSGIPDGPGRLIDITVWRKQNTSNLAFAFSPLTGPQLDGRQKPPLFHTLCVSLTTVMSDSKARIIQAYFNGDKLVIRKSRLYDFSTPETLSSSTTLFMQWMASKTGGNTSGFPLEDFEPFEEDDDTELFGKKEIEKISDAP
ncbi:hypothetical protein KXW58_003399 [Aspergillus fumigatus]|nr:hypothetical protein KXW58_003399 [Aspergillus fumigatus]